MKKFALTLLLSALILAILIPAISETTPLTLNLSSLTIGVKQSVKTVRVTSGHTDVTWSSSDEKIASVDETGKIKGVKKGTAIITAASGSEKAEVTVTVAPKDKGVKKIKLNKKSVTLEAGKSVKLKATLTPAKPKDKTIAWLSSDETIATVNSKGKIKAVAPGKATITAISSSGKTAQCEVTVMGPKVRKITILGKNSMTAGETQQLSVEILPANAENQAVKWKSSNKDVAKVTKNGLVTAVGPGKTTITATAKDGSKVKGSVKITVSRSLISCLRYKIESDGSVTITGYDGSYSDIEIPATIEGKPVRAIGASAFYMAGLESIVLPDTLKSVGASAFACNVNMSELTFPDSVTYIAKGAFTGCNILEKLTLPAGITDPNAEFFSDISNMPAIKDLTINCRLTYIPDEFLYACGTVEKITLPETVKTIGAAAFHSCYKLKTINIPASVEYIDEFAFAYCQAMEKFTIPDGISQVGGYIFYQCTGLREINFPSSLHAVTKAMCCGCTSLVNITVPEGVKEVSYNAFQDCKNLETARLPDSLEFIAPCSFWYDDKVTILCSENSYAHRHCLTYGIPFQFVN